MLCMYLVDSYDLNLQRQCRLNSYQSEQKVTKSTCGEEARVGTRPLQDIRIANSEVASMTLTCIRSSPNCLLVFLPLRLTAAIFVLTHLLHPCRRLQVLQIL